MPFIFRNKLVSPKYGDVPTEEIITISGKKFIKIIVVDYPIEKRVAFFITCGKIIVATLNSPTKVIALYKFENKHPVEERCKMIGYYTDFDLYDEFKK